MALFLPGNYQTNGVIWKSHSCSLVLSQYEYDTELADFVFCFVPHVYQGSDHFSPSHQSTSQSVYFTTESLGQNENLSLSWLHGKSFTKYDSYLERECNEFHISEWMLGSFFISGKTSSLLLAKCNLKEWLVLMLYIYVSTFNQKSKILQNESYHLSIIKLHYKIRKASYWNKSL